MKSIRIVAVGLVFAAVLMVGFAQTFFTFWQTSVNFQAWAMALGSLSPSTVSSMGIGAVAFTVLLLSCLGIGLMLSATIYVKMEQALLDAIAFKQLVSAPETRHIESFGK